MRVLLWHVHGSYTTSLVQGPHTYLLPVNAARDADGLGRARTWRWPDSTHEVALTELRGAEPDVIVLQRPEEVDLVRRHLGAEPGVDVAAVYLEHNTPRGDLAVARHPLAERSDIPVVHVTGFNELYWDCGAAPTSVIPHGIVDPGLRYTGELPRAAVAINSPVRRGRITGTDLLPAFAEAAGLDVFGMQVEGLPAALGLTTDQMTVHEDPPQSVLHVEMPRRRVYLHPMRWTSLGLSLLEAMALGMPVVALAATEAIEAVPPGAGVLSTRRDVLAQAVRDFVHDPARARQAGLAAREAVLARHGLDRFLDDWNLLLKEVV